MEVKNILLKWVIPDIKNLILGYIMETFQIRFLDDNWNHDKMNQTKNVLKIF